jgi:hypothetical protein
MAERKNRTFFLDLGLMEKASKQAKVENRSTNRMVEVMIAEYLRRRGVDLGPDFPEQESID